MHSGKIRYLITSSNTSQGFRTFIPDLLDDLEKVYIVKGVPGTGKATLIRFLGEKAAGRGLNIEYWISAVDPQSPEGLYIPDLNTAVINGSLPVSIDASYPGVRDQILDLNTFLADLPVNEIEEIKVLFKDAEKNRMAGSKYLREAQSLKKEMEQLICRGIDVDKYKQAVKNLANTILNRRAGEKHYFATAFTPDGVVSYVNELSAEYQKRYIFKGCGSFSKYSVINEIAQEIKKGGYYVEYYHSGLEPKKVLMVIVKDLQLVLLEAGEIKILHRPEDIIVNLRDCMKEETQGDADEELSALYQNYEELLQKIQTELNSLRQQMCKIEKHYAANMNFSGLEKLKEEMFEDLLDLK